MEKKVHNGSIVIFIDFNELVYGLVSLKFLSYSHCFLNGDTRSPSLSFAASSSFDILLNVLLATKQHLLVCNWLELIKHTVRKKTAPDRKLLHLVRIKT